MHLVNAAAVHGADGSASAPPRIPGTASQKAPKWQLITLGLAAGYPSSALAAFLVLKRHSDRKGRVFSTSSPRRWFEPAVKAAGLLLFTWHSPTAQPVPDFVSHSPFGGARGASWFLRYARDRDSEQVVMNRS